MRLIKISKTFGEILANTFLESISILQTKISSVKFNWKWHIMHSREYPHFPFSWTSIRRFFFLEYPYGGSKNTIDSCLYYLSDYYKDSFD